MKNTAHLVATFYLLFDTDLTAEEFKERYTPEHLVGSEVAVTLPDGSVHKAKFADMLDANLEEFEDDKKDTKHNAQ